jgi:hypothetical protein
MHKTESGSRSGPAGRWPRSSDAFTGAASVMVIPIPLPRLPHFDPVDPQTDSRHRLNNGHDTWRARCGENRTPGSAGGLWKLPTTLIITSSAAVGGQPRLLPEARAPGANTITLFVGYSTVQRSRALYYALTLESSGRS